MVDDRHPGRTRVPEPRRQVESYEGAAASGVTPAALLGSGRSGHARGRLPDGHPQRFDPDRSVRVTVDVDQAGR